MVSASLLGDHDRLLQAPVTVVEVTGKDAGDPHGPYPGQIGLSRHGRLIG